MKSVYALILMPCLVFALAGCGVGDDAAQPDAELDPAIVQALNDQLLADPDLANQNEANAALSFSIDHSLPTQRVSDQSTRRARAIAVEMVGGEQRLTLPPVSDAERKIDFAGRSDSLDQRIAALPDAGQCASRLQISAIWAARMPEIFPVYPFGATQIAGGVAEAPTCDLRGVRFHSSGKMDDIAAFYAVRAKTRGFEVHYLEAAGAALVSGRRGTGYYRVELRQLSPEIVEVDLMTNRV